MKKTLLLCLILILSFLMGCQKKYAMECEADHLYLMVGDHYSLEVYHPNNNPITYRDPKGLISISNEGLITALIPGTTTLYIEAKETQTIMIPIEVVESPAPLTVHFVDVGQADCIIAILPNEEVLMIDCGLDYESTMGNENYPSWTNIQAVLSEENIEVIDHLIITHNHSDHYYYVPEIMSNYTVRHVYSSGTVRYNSQYLAIMRAIENAGLSVEVVETGDFIIDEGPLTLQVVGTQIVEANDNMNYASVMTKLSYYDRSFLFTGDAGFDADDGEPIALASGIDLESDVLKVGHHGSSYSSGASFLQAVLPLYAVITTANITSTGHPHWGALNRLTAVNATILETKDYGTITFTTNGFTLTYETEK